MTKIFRMLLVGAMVAGLMSATLGGARADDISGGANGTSFEWTIPTLTIPGVDAPKLEFELNGEKHTIGGGTVVPGSTVGGVLRVAFRGSDWLVSRNIIACPAGQIGTGVTLAAKTPGVTLQVDYTPAGGQTQIYSAPPVENRYPTANFGLCA